MHEIVKDYYGNQLQSSSDLRTTACCDFTAVPEWMKAALSKIHDEVLSRYYGCGLVVPQMLDGCRVLDLGCGSGRDVYALSQLVGEHGSVVGVDMTPEQLAVAEKHQGISPGSVWLRQEQCRIQARLYRKPERTRFARQQL
jgi:arsenite methyltransferase